MSALPAVKDLRDWKDAVNQRLASLLPPVRHPSDTVSKAMRDGLLGPGKRIRPLMTIGVSLGLEQDPKILLDIACAIEMVHAASLFLDDLPCMDNATERRGRPALHIQYGEATAMLASVGLLSHAFRVIASADNLPSVVRTELVTMLADAIGPCGLVHGQHRDLRVAQRPVFSEQTLYEVNDLKTGVLFRVAMVIPAIAGRADAGTVDALARCATDIGHAFQLRDDLEDADGPPGGTAERNLVGLRGRDHVDASLERHLKSAEQTIRLLFPRDQALLLLVHSIAAGRIAPTAA